MWNHGEFSLDEDIMLSGDGRINHSPAGSPCIYHSEVGYCKDRPESETLSGNGWDKIDPHGGRAGVDDSNGNMAH